MNEPQFPATRYQGSKRKLADAIFQAVRHLDFDTVLDAFGGTGAISFLMKSREKKVTYNDCFRFNLVIGRALIENDRTTLPREAARALFEATAGARYDDVVTRCFEDVFFTPEENRWIDVTCQNIHRMKDRFQRAIALFALFQACLVKRPYNLFHRANLNMRLRSVKRTFGNKVTWDTPFPDHFLRFVDQANRAVFSNGRRNTATRHDAAAFPRTDFDLVYIDTPYMNSRGVGVDYLDFYHFLEGLCLYPEWEGRLDAAKKHRPLRHPRSEWCDRHRIHAAFSRLFARFDRSHLAISYRSDGIPAISELKELLESRGRRTEVLSLGNYKYALSGNSASRESLLLSEKAG